MLLVILGVVAVAPTALLVLRAASSAWRYPEIFAIENNSRGILMALSSSAIRSALQLSVLLALATAFVSTAFGFAVARVLVRGPGKLRQLASAAAFLPVIAPPIALGVGIQVMAIRLGVGGSPMGVLIAHIIPAAGYLTLYFLGVMSAYDSSLEEQARSLGANAFQTFMRVTVPVLRARWLEALALGALISWGQLALTLLIGGGAVQTLPVALLAFVGSGDDQLAAAAAVMLTLPPAVAFALVQRGTNRTGVAA